MKKVVFALFAFQLIIFSACDDLGVDPDITVADCLTQGDVDHYANFISNEKEVSSLLKTEGLDPANIEAEKRQSLHDQLVVLNNEHDELRTGFECQYWGEDNSFLDFLGGDDTEAAAEFLDPVAFKEQFKITSENVLVSLSQSDWAGKDVYIFPGISRVPWEGSSQASKEQAIERINQAYNDVRVEQGLPGDVQLFDPVEDYLFPHATFHQQFVTAYATSLISPDNQDQHDLVSEMLPVEDMVIEKFIVRAPDTINL